MGKKFDKVPVEEDTKILVRQEMKLGKYEVLYERWFWEGVYGESLIFANADISGMTDREIEREIRKSPLIKEGSEITLKRTKDFTFVNFNFETP